MFHTLKYAKILEEVGLPREQAEAQVQIIAEILEDDMATKGDLQIVETSLKTEISNLRTELKNDMTALRTELKNDMTALRTELKNDMVVLRTEIKGDMSLLEHRIVFKLGAIVVTTTTLAVAFSSWLLKVH